MPALHPLNRRRPYRWKEQMLILYFGLTDPGTPFFARIPAIISLLYLLSPVDLIPDFIPFAGWLDDLVVVPLLLSLSLRWIPSEVKERSRIKAGRESRRMNIFLILLIILLLGIFIGIVLLIRTILRA